MSTQTQVAFEKMIFRKTNSQTGRHVSVTPQNSTMRHLAYGRVILNSSKPSVSFSDGDRETGLICLSGKATVKAAGKEFELAKFDAIYIPRDSSIEISTNTSVDLAEFSAEVNRKYPLKVVRYADVEKDPGLKFVTGGPGSSRELNMLIAKNVEAGRLLPGYALRSGQVDELASARAFPLGDGSSLRSGRPAVWCREYSTGIQQDGFGLETGRK